MCTGAEIALIAGSAVAATAVVQQGQATREASKSQATVLNQQAERERQQAAANEGDFRRRERARSAAIRAARGGTGVQGGAGTPLLTASDREEEVELQALRIRGGGDLRATRAEQQAALLKTRGRAAQRAGFVRGGSLLVSGTAQSGAFNR